MTHKTKLGRREALVGILGAGGVLAAGTAAAQPPRRVGVAVATTTAAAPLKRPNSYYYGPDGKFDEAKAKEAVLAMLRAANYPISENLKQNMWVADFGLGRFAEVGLGGMFWVNNQQDNYTSLEMFLLPDQMIPEHWHVPLPDQKVPVKMESWHVRWGSTYTYGGGEPTAKLAVKIPESEAEFVTVRKEKMLKVGEVTGITKPEEKHWQQAGPQGAIITETSTFHSGAAVRFTNPKIKF